MQIKPIGPGQTVQLVFFDNALEYFGAAPGLLQRPQVLTAFLISSL